MIARRLTLATLASLCALGGGLAFLCAPAPAARGHVFERTFGAAGAGNGQFKEPSGVAVNEASGDVYVVDKGNDRVEWFSAAGVYLGQFDGSGAFEAEGKVETGATAGGGGLPGEVPTGKFEKPDGIAVDNACRLHKPELTSTTSPTCEEFDPSNGDVYVVDGSGEIEDGGNTGHQVVDKFSPTGEYIGQVTETGDGTQFSELFGVGVDTKGELWVYYGIGIVDYMVENLSNGVPNVLGESRALAAPEGLSFTFSGFTVDSEDNLYSRHELSDGEQKYRISKSNSEGKTLIQEFDEELSTAVAVELSNDDAYVENVTSVGVFDPSGTQIERLGSGHLVGGSGIGVSSSSETVYVADSSADVVDVYGPAPPSSPTVESESVSDVTGNSATLSGEVNPRGAGTEYHFEYGPCASLSACASSAYGTSTPVPNGSLSGDFAVHSVGVSLQGLSAGTVYHFRVVASNEIAGTVEITDGVEQTFTTQIAGGGFVLPDGREWELVSPPDKHGALIETIGGEEGHITQAAANSSALTYVTVTPTESAPQGYSNLVQVLAVRGASGWGSQDIASPHDTATGFVGQGEYRFFSEDLSVGALQPAGAFTPSLSEEASEQTAYLRTTYLNGNIDDPCTDSCYRPLVTGCPPAPEACRPSVEEHADVPRGTDIDKGGGTGFLGPQFVGATPDMSHVVLQSKVALTSAGKSGLYEWGDGKLAPVSVLRNGEMSSGGPGLGYPNGFGPAIARHAISADGSRIVWSEHDPGGKHLYMRDMGRGETVQLDVVQQGGSFSEGEPVFQAASSDGSKVFFTDAEKLIKDSGERDNELYECEMTVAAGKLECKLSDLTPMDAEAHRAEVEGEALGVGEDGSYIYFVANGALASGAVKGTCKSSQSGATCNLYVAHHDGTGWETKLVAVLSGEDVPDWYGQVFFLSDMTSRVSPDGRWLAFMSQRSLTGYDTRDAVDGVPDEEVYLYDASAGRVTCASCNPTGARPVGVTHGRLLSGVDGDKPQWGPNAQFAGRVPTWTSYQSGNALYQSRYLSDGGRLFFNGGDALVPQDVNGTGDVYEYEPSGVGDCSRSSVTFSERSDGCVGLISSGSSAEESGFLDASEGGGDVFFLTTAKLVTQDYDSAFDVYDAHECTDESRCFVPPSVQAPPCGTGDSCKPAPSPQPSIFGSPASATFSGVGNVIPSGSALAVKRRSLARTQKLARALKACRKRHRKKPAACERQARKRYGHAKSSKAGATRKGRG